MQRIEFLQSSFIAGVSIPLLQSYSHLWKGVDAPFEKLTLIHTNDTHSRIDPFEDGEYKGLGGVIARKQAIDEVRTTESNTLLLDAGDIFQGTPYFNMYQGEIEMKAMSYLGYDASTIGNHDFDNGAANLAKQMDHANFPFIISNYDVTDSNLANKVAPYIVFNKGKIKVGVLGIGIELDGLVSKKNYGNIIYQDPVEVANRYARILKEDENCDIIICLSHLGYSYKSKKISDLILAEKVDNIDVIIGGHTHTFLDCPTLVQKPEKKFVIINQVGFGGITLGKLDIYFNRNKKAIEKNLSNLIKCQI
ncbi:MAG: metallophosphoesterase [Chitinophagales bacterium]|nr:metallophosphoesterase [Chitinophagales bacterium]